MMNHPNNIQQQHRTPFFCVFVAVVLLCWALGGFLQPSTSRRMCQIGRTKKRSKQALAEHALLYGAKINEISGVTLGRMPATTQKTEMRSSLLGLGENMEKQAIN